MKQNGIGIMPEDNFIYWDDMEWGYRIKLAGYRVVTLAEAKALHQMGANDKEGKHLYQLLYVEKPDQFLYAVYAGGADGGNEC